MTIQQAITSLVQNDIELTEDFKIELAEQFNYDEDQVQFLYDYEIKK
jgi:plasmid maintenance system antidote protein VapI